MNVHSVMQEIATRLDTIEGLRVFSFPPDHLAPPTAIVAYPEEITFDKTYGRGMDVISLPVWVVAGRVSDRGSRDVLIGYCHGSGSSSIKQVVESKPHAAFDTVRVKSAEFLDVEVAGIHYAAAKFMLDIAGDGA